MLVPADIVDSVVEVELIEQEVSSLDDNTLVDEIMHLIQEFDFSKETEEVIANYLIAGSLTDRERKVLEGCYINVYSSLGITEDGRIEYNQLYETL